MSRASLRLERVSQGNQAFRELFFVSLITLLRRLSDEPVSGLDEIPTWPRSMGSAPNPADLTQWAVPGREHLFSAALYGPHYNTPGWPANESQRRKVIIRGRLQAPDGAGPRR
jgi:hypothetical protein